MSKLLSRSIGIFFCFFLLFTVSSLYSASNGHGAEKELGQLSNSLVYLDSGYGDETGLGIWGTLVNRVSYQPFHLVSFLLFMFAIIHTFIAHNFTHWAHQEAERHHARRQQRIDAGERFYLPEHLEKDVSFKAEIFHFLGEIEVIFGLWIVPLLISISFWGNWNTAMDYIESRNFTEPLFVIVIMSLASARPVIRFAEKCLSAVANIGGGTPAAWWLSILIIGPLMGSLITEPGAMTISALLLAKQFYKYSPSMRLKYATLGLLFVNVSVGGVLTHFAAPPVLMVAGPWGWDSAFMLVNFGWKAVIGILIATSLYFLFFRSDLNALAAKKVDVEKNAEEVSGDAHAEVPVWITCVHLFLLAWTVFHAHHPVIFIGLFLFYLGFYQATAPHQSKFSLRPSLLVGFFLAGLVIHGGMQRWWIEPVLQGVSENMLMALAIGLTAFNDNAAVTYLTTLIPNLADGLKYAVVAGAVTGGGLTVIANAPNPAGQSLLSSYFDNDISPAKLAAGALVPTLIMAACFLLL